MIRCSVVIPTYCGTALTGSCIAAIRAHPPRAPFEIVVVDDASPDGSGAQLSDLSDVKFVQRSVNGGFAFACNDGALAASGDLLVFLNNDTLPKPGWLDALVEHFDQNPSAGAVGSKLLYPDGTVQHAGVVIGQDGFPRHVYAGFAADHPAVNRPRVFQSVTAACLLVSRSVFLDMNGFDTEFRNGMEDVDLCLRLGDAGHEIHYCPSSELVHLESVTRGRQTAEIRDGIRRFRERWEGRVSPDDLRIYQEDGLLQVKYDESYPLELELAPELAVLGEERSHALDRQLLLRSRQATALLRDLVDLSVVVAKGAETTSHPDRIPAANPALTSVPAVTGAPVDHADVGRRIDAIALAIHRLQEELAAATGSDCGLPTSQLDYRSRSEVFRRSVVRHAPRGGTVLVASRGDDALLELEGCTAWHFPRSDDGQYAGHYPANGEAAIAHLEELRELGAACVVFPSDGLWWLDHYPALGKHLRQLPKRELDNQAGVMFSLVPVETHVSIC